MIDILRPILELTVILPGALIAYLPMKHHLRISRGHIALICILALPALCIAGGSLCYFFKIKTLWVNVPILLITGIAYCHTLNLTRWKSVSVILAICGVFSCINSILTAIDAIICPNNTDEWFCISTGLIYNLLCWVIIFMVWHPSTHAARNLLEEDGIAKTWYVFWILPTAIIALTIFIAPINTEILYQGRLVQVYIVNSAVLLVLLLLFYSLFYLMARSLNKNDRLRQENQFLSMQQTQYKMLCTSIEETRQARHDMRHHFSALATLASRKEWTQLEEYIAQVQESIPSTKLNLCNNPAVDGVASHFAALIKGHDIPFSIKFDLPYNLQISEMDACLVLSNLLENALEASLHTNKAKRYIKVQAYTHSDNVILISVENAFDGIIKKKNDIFQSSKHSGNGVGIQSVRRIAEKNGGYSSFTWAEGLFCANIMLRGNNNSN